MSPDPCTGLLRGIEPGADLRLPGPPVTPTYLCSERPGPSRAGGSRRGVPGALREKTELSAGHTGMLCMSLGRFLQHSLSLGWSRPLSILPASSQLAMVPPASSPQYSPSGGSRTLASAQHPPSLGCSLTPQHPPPRVPQVAAGAPQGCPPTAPVHTERPWFRHGAAALGAAALYEAVRGGARGSVVTHREPPSAPAPATWRDATTRGPAPGR